MKRILREPLLHFLLLGVAIFVAYGYVAKRSGGQPGKIVITQGLIDHLAISFAKTWQRPPTEQEMEGLIRDHVREEVFYREAIVMGLDQDDTVIRRRLRQKMEFVSDDIAARPEPTDDELNAYLQSHADAFRIEQRFTFQQVYLNPQKHGDNLPQEVAQLLTQLNQDGAKADVTTLGDSFLLEHHFTAMPVGEITKEFGEAFGRKLSGLQAGPWHGPIESGYGTHLVKISERTKGHLPTLNEVRAALRREWENAQRLESNEQFYQELLQRYSVIIEQPRPLAVDKKAGKAP